MFVMEQLNAPVTSEKVKAKVNERKNKRKWLKRRKERQRNEAQVSLAKREQLNRHIDNEREVITQEELKQKKVQNILWPKFFRRLYIFK